MICKYCKKKIGMKYIKKGYVAYKGTKSFHPKCFIKFKQQERNLQSNLNFKNMWKRRKNEVIQSKAF